MTLKQLIDNIDLKALALPSNIAYGTAIFERSAVQNRDINICRCLWLCGGGSGSLSSPTFGNNPAANSGGRSLVLASGHCLLRA